MMMMVMSDDNNERRICPATFIKERGREREITERVSDIFCAHYIRTILYYFSSNNALKSYINRQFIDLNKFYKENILWDEKNKINVVLLRSGKEFIITLSWFSKDNATANRTARAQENNRLGLGRELGRVARKSDLAKNNRTCGMWKHMFSKFVCSLVLWGISRLFFALLKSDWEHKHAWLMNLVRWPNHLARWMECSILNRF